MSVIIAAKIYEGPEQEQVVKIDFEYYPVRKFFGNRINYFVNYCKVIDPIELHPTDLDSDIQVAIAEHFGVDPKHIEDVKIESEILFKAVTPVLV